MGLKEIIARLTGQKTADPAMTEYSVAGGASYAPAEIDAGLMRAAEFLCRDFIASAVSKCEFRTFLNGREIFGEEYYLWNVSPNPSQTSTEFWREVIYRLYTDGEALIVPVGGRAIIADSFSTKEYALLPTVYSNVTRGTMTLAGAYDSTTAIHLTLPEGMRPHSLAGGIQRVLGETLGLAIDKYRKDGGEHGTYEMSAMQMGNDEDYGKISRQINEKFKSYFDSVNAVLTLNNGAKYTPQTRNMGQKTSIVSDITAVLAQSLTTEAQAHKIPPTLILGTVADTKTAVSNFLTFCIDPLLDMITEGMNRVRYGRELLNGSYISADTSRIEHIDALSIAGDLDKLKGAGLFSTNEIRRKISEPRINEEWADEYTLTKNYAHEGTQEEDNRDENI
jgi:phage portal protein|nr:MAG TPA: portal protein [Caudoviricetes sp.]